VVQREQANIQGDLYALSQVWRQKQLEYTWLRALSERYEDFWQVTEAALRFAVRRLSINANDSQLDRLMEAYLNPAAFDEARSALEALKGSKLAILSNGSLRMLGSAVRSNGLESCFTEIISVDRVKTYKPSPRVYAFEPEILTLPPGRDSICFLQLMGCRWSQGLWLSGLLVQPIRSRSGRRGALPILRSSGLTGSLRRF
jgi:2-haloacid dehalogenase